MITRDLQAIHQILSVFEKSKIQSDLLLDTLPITFMVIDQSGDIFRGNNDAALLFNINFENLVGKNIFSLFSEENRLDYIKYFEHVLTGECERAQFDLSVCLESGSERLFVWDISSFHADLGEIKLFKVIGRDVTDFRKQIAESAAIAKELEVTKAIHSLILPKQFRVSTSKLEMSTYYQPAEQVGGDWWWYDQVEESSPLILLADVSGHGVGAAMVTAVLGGTYHMIKHLTRGLHGEEKVKKIFEMINLNLIQTCGEDHWVCLSAIQVLQDKNELVFWNAGGSPVLIKRKDGRIEVLRQPSRPLVGWAMELEPVRCQLFPGDRFFIFSDGVIDFNESNGAQFSLTKFKRVLMDYEGTSIDEMLDQIVNALVSRQQPNSRVNDDRTLIAVEYRGV